MRNGFRRVVVAGALVALASTFAGTTPAQACVGPPCTLLGLPCRLTGRVCIPVG